MEDAAVLLHGQACLHDSLRFGERSQKYKNKPSTVIVLNNSRLKLINPYWDPGLLHPGWWMSVGSDSLEITDVLAYSCNIYS